MTEHLDRLANHVRSKLRVLGFSSPSRPILRALLEIANEAFWVPMPSGKQACVLALLLLVRVAAAAVPWQPSLYLANGGYWPQRVPVTITNGSAEAVAIEPLGLSFPDLAGARVESLRVCRADGVELLFDLHDARGLAKRAGQLGAEDKLIVPVECPAHTTTTLFVYAGNSVAWAVPDFLSAKFVDRATRPGSAGLGVSIGKVERLLLRPPRTVKPRLGRDWKNWVEVRVRRFDEEAGSTALVRVNLRKALARLPEVSSNPATCVASSDGAELTSFSLGQGADLLFSANLLPMTEELFQVGFRLGSPVDGPAVIENYGRLLASSVNLAANASFENGSDGPDEWLKPGDGGPHRVTAGFSRDARFGKRSLELTALENAKGDWLGWNSRDMPVKPGATYLLSGWLKGIKLQSGAAVHAHFHDAQGALTKSGAMVSTQPTVSGDSDWVNLMGFFQAPPDAATIQLHLTMNTQGTLRHDGIVLCEVVDGKVGRVHSAAGKATGPALRVWEVNPLVKVFPDTPPQVQARAISVELARNEYQAFQLALRIAAAGTNKLRVAVSPLKSRDGSELPPVKVERVGYVPVDYPSAYYSTEVPEWCRKVPQGAGATDGWAGWWPDPLAPGSSLDLSQGQTQPVWFTVHAPKLTAPGWYQAEVTLSPSGRKTLKIPLTVQVLPFTLPDQGRLRAIFDLRFGPGGGFGSGADSKEDQRKWLRFIAEHRLGINEIHPPPKFSYQDGKVTMDAAEFDEMARFCFDELGMNVAYTPQFFYMFGWAYPPKKLFGLDPFTPEWTAAFQQAYRLFTDHLRQKGWHDKFVYYVSDEPHFQHDFVVAQMKKLCVLIHEVDSTIPIYSSTWRHCAAWDDSLDLWGIGQYGCFPVDEMERLQRAGKQMWFTCDGQMATDTPFLATERLLPYYCLKYGMSGFEFWGLAWWTYNPWQTGWHQFIRQSDEGKKYYWVRYPNGDGFLAYPGKPVGVDGPASTIRLEQIRQGLQDYEALSLLAEWTAKAKQAGRSAPAAERALAMARDLVAIPNAGGLRSTEILPNPDRIPAIRKAVNAALVHLISQRQGLQTSAP